jgi:hypothetical protein
LFWASAGLQLVEKNKKKTITSQRRKGEKNEFGFICAFAPLRGDRFFLVFLKQLESRARPKQIRAF